MPDPSSRISVLLPLPLGGRYDYQVTLESDYPPGAVIEVPFGGRKVTGVVWGPGEGIIPDSKLKTAGSVLPLPLMTASLRQFVDRVAAYTLTSPGAVLRMVLNTPKAFSPERGHFLYKIPSDGPIFLKSPIRQRIINFLADGAKRSISEIAQNVGCSSGLIKTMAKAGELVPIAAPPAAPFSRPKTNTNIIFSPPQERAAQVLRETMREGTFSATLLEGVTGSGKTEVYFEAIAAVIAQEQQSLVLLPEIALTTQWLDRFVARFGVKPAIWHSDLSAAQRRITWRAIAEGGAPVVIGARSALFLPFPDLGLIVVDEEHEAAYKQEDGVIYHARDMAVLRAHIAKHPIILVSATPSLETLANVEADKYRRLHLPNRHGNAQLPHITAVDMRKYPPPRGHFLSPPLAQALQQNFEQKGQSLLFLNRRGYAPLTLCRSCGHRLQCPNCTAWLVEHRQINRLQCHHCGYALRIPQTCPQCQAVDSFTACGPGVERLAEEAAILLPKARIALMTSDNIANAAAAEGLIHDMIHGKIDLLIGTQIIAKGHHFPALTLVGIVDADLGLAGGDLRAAERTFQLLNQVAGRAGREDRPGQVFLQTYDPSQPVIAALAEGSEENFLTQEMNARKAATMPPYGKLAALILSASNEKLVDQACRDLAAKIPHEEGIIILGPAPAPLAILRRRHRRRFLLKSAKNLSLQSVIKKWIKEIRLPRTVRLQVDIDPYSFL
ncbi:MAG: primosomal protein N' [Alphaproteobacteria bacterium]